MRLLLVVMIWFVFVGGVAFYTSKETKPIKFTTPNAPKELTETYDCKVFTSFSAAADPFALEGSAESVALRVSLNGKDVLVRKGMMDAASAQEESNISGFQAGVNEIFIEAHPPVNEYGRGHAARLVLSKGNHTIVDRSLWSAGGTPIVTTIRFSLKAGEKE